VTDLFEGICNLRLLGSQLLWSLKSCWAFVWSGWKDWIRFVRVSRCVDGILCKFWVAGATDRCRIYLDGTSFQANQSETHRPERGDVWLCLASITTMFCCVSDHGWSDCSAGVCGGVCGPQPNVRTVPKGWGEGLLARMCSDPTEGTWLFNRCIV